MVKYAILVNYRNGKKDIVTLWKEFDSPEREADFRAPPHDFALFGNPRKVIRYKKLEKAMAEARDISHDDNTRLTGVVPVDQGKLLYREGVGEVRFGRPMVIFKKGKQSKKYNLVDLLIALNETIVRDNHWLPDSMGSASMYF